MASAAFREFALRSMTVFDPLQKFRGAVDRD